MSKFAVAGLQLEAVNGNNLESMAAEIRAVTRRFGWVDMVVLGELNAFGSSIRNAQPMPGPAEAEFCELARELDIWLVPGSLMEAAGDQHFNTAPVINPEGEVVARSRKLFPWYPYENGVAPGSDAVVFEVPGVGHFGVSICYDLWFPETLRTLTCMGAEVILHPSLTSTIDRDVEHCLIRASGATHQCYIFDVNVAGPLGVGRSMVAGPGGEIIHEAGPGREIFPLILDLDYLREVRESGWHGLGQPLKSFRDSAVRFPPYAEGYRSEALDALGPLQPRARRGSRE